MQASLKLSLLKIALRVRWTRDHSPQLARLISEWLIQSAQSPSMQWHDSAAGESHCKTVPLLITLESQEKLNESKF